MMTDGAMVPSGGGAVVPSGGGTKHEQKVMEIVQPMLAEGETVCVYGLAQSAVGWALGLLIAQLRKYYYLVLTDRRLILIRVKGGVDFGWFFRRRWLLNPVALLVRYYAKPKVKEVREIPLGQISNAWVKDSMAAARGLAEMAIVSMLKLKGVRIELQGDKPIDLIIDHLEMGFPNSQQGLQDLTAQLRQLKQLPPPPAGGVPN
jgi:hypothetical protein